MMKRFLILLFAVFTASAAFAQYPNAPNKLRLGAQTTGDGLIYRHAGTPSWTPTGINNAWQSIDTLTGDLYTYRGGTWFLEVKGDLQQVYPLVINKTGGNILRGQVVGVDTSQIVQGDQIRIMPAIGDGGLSSNLIMGVAANDIADNASGYVAWFGYVRQIKQSEIAQTGITLNVGDILYLSATEPGRLTNVEPTPPALKTTIALVVRKPNANNMTLLVRPKLNEDLRDLNDVDLNGINDGQTIVWDSINTKWIAGDVGSAIDTTTIATKFYVDSKVDSTRLLSDSILVYYIGGVELRRDTLSLPPAGVTSITAGVGLTGGTITSTGTIAADTATVLATKDYVTTRGYLTTEVDGSVTNEGVLGVGAGGANTAVITSNTSGANGVTISGGVGALVTETTSTNGGTVAVAVDTANIVSKTFLNNQGYTTGGVSGSGTTNTVAKFTGTSAIGNSLITDNGSLVSVGGTVGLRLPNGTTVERPGSPVVGVSRFNTLTNNFEIWSGTQWESFSKSFNASGIINASEIPFADANGRLTAESNFTWDAGNNYLNIKGNLLLTQPAAANANFIYLNSTTAGAVNNTLGFIAAGFGSTVNNTNGPYFGARGNTYSVLANQRGNIFFSAGFPSSPVNGEGQIRFISGSPEEIVMAIDRGKNVGIGTGNGIPERKLHVAGEVRITDLTTDTPTRIVGADADGDLGAITVSTGLTLSGGNLSVTSPNGVTNLSFVQASPSLFQLASSTGTDVAFSEGDGIDLSLSGTTLTVGKASPIYAVVTVDSNRTSTFLAASVTPDTIDNPKISQVGGVFSIVGNGIQYTSGTARTFLITANADFKFSEANNIVKFQGWRSNGGTVIDLGTFGTVESVLGNETMHTSFSAITSLSNNDLLRFGFTPAAHTGDDTLVLTNLSITITQL